MESDKFSKSLIHYKIIHNEVPYDNFLAEELKNKTITTPLQAIQKIVKIATAIYEKLVIEVGK